MESRDLRRTIGAITDSAAFAKISKTKPDLTAVDGVAMSLAVTGFESSEYAVDGDSSVLNFRPRFVAAIETGAWSWQTTSFIEDKVGEFINEAYGGGVELTTSPRDGGQYFVWTAQDGRKAFALQLGSLVLFGNDESAIDKCLAVKRGESESIAGDPKLSNDESIAFAHVAPQGVAQIANIYGISLAMEAGEDPEVKSFIARVLPEILRSSVREVTWQATAGDGAIVDRYDVVLSDASTRIFSESMAAGGTDGEELSAFIPRGSETATRYDLADAQLAWKSVLINSRGATDAVSGKLIETFSTGLFEAYAIENPDLFLASVAGPIVTVKLDADSDDAAVIARTTNPAEAKRSVANEINFVKAPEKVGDVELWTSEDGDIAAAFAGSFVILGDAEVVRKCVAERQTGAAAEHRFEAAPISTVSTDADTPASLARALGTPSGGSSTQTHRVSTNFDGQGMHRTVRSEYGLLGTLIAQFVPEKENR